MVLEIFSVYDSKAGAFLQPFFAQSKGSALRSFQDAACTQDHLFCKHASDFTLFHLGEFDDSTGRIVLRDAFEPLGTALEYVKRDALEQHLRGGNVAEIRSAFDVKAVDVK